MHKCASYLTQFVVGVSAEDVAELLLPEETVLTETDGAVGTLSSTGAERLRRRSRGAVPHARVEPRRVRGPAGAGRGDSAEHRRGPPALCLPVPQAAAPS